MSSHRAAMYKMEIIEEIRRKLRALPQPIKDHVSKIELVRELADEIAEQQKRGHSTERIAELIAGSGVPFTSSTLKTYLSKAKPQGRKPRRRRWRDSLEAIATPTNENVAVAPVEAPVGVAAQTSGGNKGDRGKNPAVEQRSVETGVGKESPGATEEGAEVTPGLQPKLQASSHPTESQTEGPVAVEEQPALTRRLQPKLPTTSPETGAVTEASVSTPGETGWVSSLHGKQTVRETPAPEAARASAAPRVEKSLQPGDTQKETPRLTAAVGEAASEREPPVSRRLTTAEIDKGRSTFVPREDTRDI